ncbi:hypothetical protein [Streptomyces sp. NPDC056672]|uniref:hypothetical protein n=1 Tax=Streptomyces sp. NPDC056672 TaxID=3345906 RepID=UPI0036942169
MAMFRRNTPATPELIPTPEPEMSEERFAELEEKNRKATRESEYQRVLAAQRERDCELAERNIRWSR